MTGNYLSFLRVRFSHLLFVWTLIHFVFPAHGFLKKLAEDPRTAIGLGDSAYNRSKVRGKIGIRTPAPLPKDGVQIEVLILPSFQTK